MTGSRLECCTRKGFLDGRGQPIALTITADEETSLDELAQEFFGTRGTQLPQSRCLCGGQAHARHLPEFGARTGGQVGHFVSRLSRVVEHREFSVAGFLQYGCHGRLTKFRRFRD